PLLAVSDTGGVEPHVESGPFQMVDESGHVLGVVPAVADEYEPGHGQLPNPASTTTVRIYLTIAAGCTASPDRTSSTGGPAIDPVHREGPPAQSCSASRRAGFARPVRAELVQVERPTGRTTWPSSARSGGLRYATGRRARAAGIPERPGPGREALAAGGRLRVVGPEALPAGGVIVRRTAQRSNVQPGDDP